jgi:ankyrin repeat protein
MQAMERPQDSSRALLEALKEEGKKIDSLKDAINSLILHKEQQKTVSQAQKAVSQLMNAVIRSKIDKVKSLLEAGVRPWIQDPSNGFATPLHFAARMGYLEIAKLLVAHGAPSRMKDWEGNTPIKIAHENGHTDIVRLFTTPLT